MNTQLYFKFNIYILFILFWTSFYQQGLSQDPNSLANLDQVSFFNNPLILSVTVIFKCFPILYIWHYWWFVKIVLEAPNSAVNLPYYLTEIFGSHRHGLLSLSL